MELNFTHVIAAVGTLVTIFGVFLKREEIISLRDKNFTAKLDSTLRFFKEFYSSNNNEKLTLDRAAQDLAKLDKVNFALIKYLITLHETNLIDFDEIIRLYRKGSEFIEFDRLSNIIDVNHIKLKIKRNRKAKKQIMIYNVQYFAFSFIAFYPLIFINNILQLFEKNKAPLAIIVIASLTILSCIMIAIVSLLESATLKDADDFIKKLIAADAQL